MSKIIDREGLAAQRQQWRQEGHCIVFTNGCFDLLHPGHIRFLYQARSLGDLLIVGINTDEWVRQLKGPGRPILNQEERCEVLAALEAVSYVTVFDEPTPRELIVALQPDILVKGGDWEVDRIVGREEVEAAGGKVHSLPYREGYSTTELIGRILHLGRS